MTKSILIVDDEVAIAFALEHLLKAEGYDAQSTGDGNVAIDLATQTMPDLLLLDVSLPGRDGYDICQTLRARPETSGIKIIMISARGRDTEIEKGLALGADAYITKPFSLSRIVSAVHGMLDGDQKQNVSA